MTDIYLNECPGCGWKDASTGFAKVERALWDGGRISLAILSCGCKIDAMGRRVGRAGVGPEAKPIWAYEQAGFPATEPEGKTHEKAEGT